MEKHAAITIVSKNYLAFAITLAESYKTHHPDNDFIIVLADRADGKIGETIPCGAEVVEITDLKVPDISRFIYRYSIMELNTAIKPYALLSLLEQRGYESILYIDPDIYIYSPLHEVYSALESASIVLIPHMRNPTFDEKLPSDLSIIQSGTYNLGFIGLRKGKSTSALLSWWMEKLYIDCVVDLPRGLFVDQKWIDLVPGLFPDHKILYHPGYNAAYWNLHEREVSFENGRWLANRHPLAFFHFSGYVPYAPTTLSKHQNRHELAQLPHLKKLTDAYASELFRNEYEESSGWTYSFDTLLNGVSLPMDIVAKVMQWCIRNRVPTPCPVTQPNLFCQFLMSRNVIPNNPDVVLLFHFLLGIRADLKAAFPAAQFNTDDQGFRSWLVASGVREHRLLDLLAFERPNELRGVDDISDLFYLVRSSTTPSVIDSIWCDQRSFDEFVEWVTGEDGLEAGCRKGHAVALAESISGINRILHIYFLRGDLQVAFPTLADTDQLNQLRNWLNENRYLLELTSNEISLFTEFAIHSKLLLEKMRLLYQHYGRKSRSEPNIYEIDNRRFEINSQISTASALDWLYSEPVISAGDHFRIKYGDESKLPSDLSNSFVAGLPAIKNFEFSKRVYGELTSEIGEKKINISGYIQAPTGMGESGRSLARCLTTTSLRTRCITLPASNILKTNIPSSPAIFNWPHARADFSITVANADSIYFVESFLPRSYWGRKNIGYWVWETETLPSRFKKSQTPFDEIWTPSSFSAEAISRTVDIPVKVLPHSLPLDEFAAVRPDRKLFRLPEAATIFGFAFDPASGFERKNVNGLIQAFRSAFRTDDNCYLILKINGRSTGSYEYESMRASVNTDRVLFIDSSLNRWQTFTLLSSLDVYVSLHRAEGFGLTCAEAMGLGVPVVATGYSGNLEFMDPSNSLLVPAKTIQTTRQFGPYPSGTVWAEPDGEAAISSMRSLLNESLRTSLGQAGKIAVQTKLSPARIGDIAEAMLDQVSGMERRPTEPLAEATSKNEESHH